MSLNMFLEIFKNIVDAVLISDEDGVVLDVNGAFCDLFGYTREEIIGKHHEVLHPFKYTCSFLEHFADHLHKKKETTIVTKTGQVKNVVAYADWFSKPVDGKKINYILFTDLSTLHTLTTLNQKLQDFMPDPVVLVRKADKVVVAANKSALEKGFVIGQHCYKKFENFNMCQFCKGNSCGMENQLVSDFHVKIRDGVFDIYWVDVDETYYLHYIMDMTDHVKKENELMDAKKKAEQSDILKSAFLANMSHEIRTPMNGILGFANLLDKPNVPEHKQKRWVDHIKKNGKILIDLIDDILDISKIEAGLVEYKKDVCDVHQLIRDIVDLFKLDIHDNNDLHISYSFLDPQYQFVICDELRTKQILINLVKNAVKFTSRGKIEVGYSCQDGYLQFRVLDTGNGISLEDQKIIFERFRQADNRMGKIIEGTGLGLSISKSLVEAMGGKIWVESILSSGSTFYFTLPYVSANVSVNSKKETGLSNSLLSNKVILYAEDSIMNSLLMQEILEEYGVSMIQAKDGCEAIELYMKHQDTIHLILMDIKMPMVNGIVATREIRKKNQDIPIIGVTAHVMDEEQQDIRDAGANDCLSKPIDTQLLIQTLTHYLK